VTLRTHNAISALFLIAPACLLAGCPSDDDRPSDGSDTAVHADAGPDTSPDTRADAGADAGDRRLSDAELRASFDQVASQTDFDVDKSMGFPDEQLFECDAFGTLQVNNVGAKQICITFADPPDRRGAPAVSSDGVDYYLELADMTQASFEMTLSELQTGELDGQTPDFTPVIAERPNRQATVGTPVRIEFNTTGAEYTSCDIADQDGNSVIDDESLAQQGDDYSTFLPADIPTGTYHATCEFGNAFGAFSVNGMPGIPRAATVSITDANTDWPHFTTMYFNPDSAVMQTDARALTRDHGNYLDANPDATVRIEGYADAQETESREAAMALGERRANAVRDFLIIQNIDRSRITTVSYGSERPTFDFLDDDALAINRRVKLIYE
jgi:outer membrane protein OmpA-like peptidoglycan-associated protein